MTPTASLTLRRTALGEALHALSAEGLRLLLLLAHRACPRTLRVWTTTLRLAEELHLAPVLLDELVGVLLRRGDITVWTRGAGALSCYEVGPLVVRTAEAPSNLPVEPDP